MITEDYVYSEIAKLLKERGFDGECDLFYRTDESELRIYEASKIAYSQDIDDECIIIPTLQMTIKWLYKNYGIYITILQVDASTVTMEQEYFFYRIQKNRKNVGIGIFTDKFKEPEQAANSAIKYVLENLI